MNIAIILAGGVGQRAKTSNLPKQFCKIQGKEVIVWTLDYFEKNSRIDAIVVVCKSDWIGKMQEIVEKHNFSKIARITPGGKSGQESIYNGLRSAKELTASGDAVILIHDGVRPIISQKLINDSIDCVIKNGNSVAVSPIKETIVMVRDEKSIASTQDRSRSFYAKAPQCFFLSEILSAHERARKEKKYDFIDSCSMMLHYDHRLFTTPTESDNIKITTPEDFVVADFLLKLRLKA